MIGAATTDPGILISGSSVPAHGRHLGNSMAHVSGFLDVKILLAEAVSLQPVILYKQLLSARQRGCELFILGRPAEAKLGTGLPK